jgi:multiple sugar transport system ATP-binding protein
MAAIAIEHLGKTFADGTQAVHDLNLEIMDGEFLVLVGPSGCGKTTALRMIAGLEEISEGSVRIGDREVNDVPARDRDVAMVFQSYALYPHLTVHENIGFGLTLRKMHKPEIDKRVREVAEILELSDYLDRKPRQLSGGQRQRVAMGRAIVRQPQAFLMDEPLSNLDAKLRVQMRAQIARIQRDLGVTTTYVTHDQTEAMTLGDRVAVMRGGVLQQVGPPQTLYEEPVNLFVAGFIGSPGMNLISADLSVDGDGKASLGVGAASLVVPESVLHQRPALRSYAGKQVAVGIRPEDMEDAEIVGHEQGTTLTSVADLVEAMGSDVMVHFPVRADAVRTEEQRAIEVETGGPITGSDDTVLVGRFSPRTRVYEGQPIQVRIDTSRLHFFDPQTGKSVWE